MDVATTLAPSPGSGFRPRHPLPAGERRSPAGRDLSPQRGEGGRAARPDEGGHVQFPCLGKIAPQTQGRAPAEDKTTLRKIFMTENINDPHPALRATLPTRGRARESLS